jgi:hypothetical protein
MLLVDVQKNGGIEVATEIFRAVVLLGLFGLGKDYCSRKGIVRST